MVPLVWRFAVYRLFSVVLAGTVAIRASLGYTFKRNQKERIVRKDTVPLEKAG